MAVGERRLGIVELQGIDNVRDLGGIPVQGGRAVTPGLFYRGGALAGATSDDCATLFGRLGIRRVIDLRTGWERAEQPDPQAPGVENLHIPFYDNDIVGIEYTRPAPGTVPIGADVAYEPEHFYRALLNPLTVGQMRKALDSAFESALHNRPVYFHCSGGKDRAGVLALLVLHALGASREAILDDYLLTNVAREKDIERVYERFLLFAGGDEALARRVMDSHAALPENLDAFYDEIAKRYGDMDRFMQRQLGVSEGRRTELRRALVS